MLTTARLAVITVTVGSCAQPFNGHTCGHLRPRFVRCEGVL